MPNVRAALAALTTLAFGTAFAADPKLGLSAGPATGPAPRITVQLTAATLGDDCGASAEPAPAAKQKAELARSKADRSCEPASMQLAVSSAAGGAPAELSVKKVELFDEGGKSVGELTARAPSVWSAEGRYVQWDQKVAPGANLSVTYPLSRPNWTAVEGRRNQTYVLKAVIAVGGSDQSVQREVRLSAPTQLPPNVKT